MGPPRRSAARTWQSPSFSQLTTGAFSLPSRANSMNKIGKTCMGAMGDGTPHGAPLQKGEDSLHLLHCASLETSTSQEGSQDKEYPDKWSAPPNECVSSVSREKKKRRKRRRRKKLQSHGNPFRVPTAFLRLQLRIWMAVQSLATGNPEFPEKPLTSRVDWSGKDQTFCSPLHDLPKNRA